MTDRQLPLSTNGKVIPGVCICNGIILSTALLIGFGIFRYLLPERTLEYSGPRALADHFFATGLLIGVLLIGGGLGLKISRWLRILPLSYLETIVFAVPMGLGVIAYGILALGLLGLLEAQYFILWFVILFFWSFQDWWELTLTGTNTLREAIHTFKRINIGKKLLLVAFILIFTLTMFQALTPPWDYDGLMYHLQGPHLFLDTGKLVSLPDNWSANGPLTTEMLYMLGLRFGSDTFAKLLHMSYAILLVIATFTFGRRFLGMPAGWIAAAILVGIPIFPVWASLAYADMAWALYEFLSVYALILWIKTQRREWVVVSALMMGFALGSKYLALGSAGILGLVVIWGSRKQGLKHIIQNAAIFGGVALLVGSPWYLKNWVWSGNPVYPLYFGGLGWPAERVQLLMTYLNGFGAGHRVSDYLLLPWNVYAHNKSFSTFLGSIEIPSLLFPLLLLYPFVRHKKYIHILLFIVLMRLVIWGVGSHQIRFLLPAFPGLAILMTSLLIGIGKANPRNRRGEILTAGLIGGVIVATIIYSLIFINMVRPFAVLWGSESKIQFLNRRVADFQAVSYIQEQLSPGERVQLLWDGRGYYCDERCIPDTDHGKWTLMTIAANFELSTLAHMLHESGITHLLFSIEDMDFILQHDPSGENYKAAKYFLNEFRNLCTELVYSDQGTYVYKITCQGINQ